MAGLQLQLDTEREEKRLLQEQLQEAEVSDVALTKLIDHSFSLHDVQSCKEDVGDHKMSRSHDNHYSSPLSFFPILIGLN